MRQAKLAPLYFFGMLLMALPCPLSAERQIPQLIETILQDGTKEVRVGGFCMKFRWSSPGITHERLDFSFPRQARVLKKLPTTTALNNRTVSSWLEVCVWKSGGESVRVEAEGDAILAFSSSALGAVGEWESLMDHRPKLYLIYSKQEGRDLLCYTFEIDVYGKDTVQFPKSVVVRGI